MMPVSASSGRWTDPLTAFFTATSATCVTGLTVVDTGSHFSLFGQIVILVLIQAGGLGIMTMSTFLLVLIGRNLSLKDEFVLIDSIGTEKVKGLRSLVLGIVRYAVLIEVIAAAVIAYGLVSRHGYGVARAAYSGVFHSISAFCNAGFSIYSDNLTGLRSDLPIILTVCAAVILGGMGFMVLFNLGSIRPWRRNLLLRGKVSLHSKVVLSATAFLLVFLWAGIALLEWYGTLDGMTVRDKLLAALFHAVIPRTAGFNVVDVAMFNPATLYLTMVSMFIGGSPGSTAGGVKTTTLVVLVLTMVAMIRGREQTELFGRSFPMQVMREAVAIFIMGIAFVAIFNGALLFTESASSLSPGRLLFETVSAFGTVGLSAGVTPNLSVAGKLCIAVCMFVGRLGPLTIAILIGRKEGTQAIRFPEEEIVVG